MHRWERLIYIQTVSREKCKTVKIRKTGKAELGTREKVVKGERRCRERDSGAEKSAAASAPSSPPIPSEPAVAEVDADVDAESSGPAMGDAESSARAMVGDSVWARAAVRRRAV
jgi:hypothetical protein